MSFRNILDKYRVESFSEKEKGTKFEELMTRYFMTDPVYKSLLKWVKIWNDFPYKNELGSVDTGIDLVAKTNSDEYWAIQCKCYAEDHYVSKKDVDTFLATSGRTFHDDDGIKSFSLRLIVATTNNQSDNATEVTKGQTIPVELVTLDILEKSQVDWDKIENGIHGDDARTCKFELREHQLNAYNKAISHYKTEDRGRMIMACGTGKTFTSLKIAEGLIKNLKETNKTPLVLFLAPSISLVRQTLWSWVSNADEKINAICVCSDISVGKRKNDDIDETTTDLGYPVTSNPKNIVIKYSKGNNFTVIFSTYQSIDSVIEAQQKGLPEID
ncbi:MAG: DEAD/DEAH box helicase family protein, partial [archaeon]|nr:DEAD/DEAH box helicase family protein [archaeon]